LGEQAPEPPWCGASLASRTRKRWRGWLRAVHRDVGYLVVGLTFVYAISGLALNHVEDWEPNFKTTEREHQLGPLSADPEAAAAEVVARLGLDAAPDDAYPIGDRDLVIVYESRTLEVDLASGRVLDTEQSPRFFVRTANWLHYNRQKGAWTAIADAYAVLLLFLAVSGALMLKGRRGLVGRGGVLILAGMGVPIVYLLITGGPSG
jgi:uncharacterized protein